MAARAQFAPASDDPLRDATPAVDDVEARRARAAIESRLFAGPAKRITVGRYRVEGKIGAGGMGVVYRAHDPELARDVALKLLNTESISDDEANRARGRLVREARAMARLAHPNVIHVYDVGAVEDGVFIAMELVDGDPLSKWISRESPSWRDTLRCYLYAGEGLAAAHEAGIVHRDFKPENVMLGSDGRVRVGDFGLAGGPGSETGRHDLPPSDSGQAEVDKASVSTSLTRTGALLGTPKYMAPEPEMGLSATVRSDQFGFCVALYEGLYGHPPFAGDTVLEYRRNVGEEAVREPELEPDGEAVPRWVFDLLRTGLHRDPLDRHTSMRALLDALREGLVDPAPPKKRRAAWLLALGVGVGIAVGVGLAMQRPGAPDPAAAKRPGDAAATTPVASAAPVDPSATRPTAAVAPQTPTGPTPDVEALPGTPINTGRPAVVPPTEDAPKAAPKKKRGLACFYKEDKRTFIHASRKRATTFRQGDTCYACRKPSAAVGSTLSPDEGITCRTNHVCRPTASDTCAD
ncbi:MAG: protein kinase [Myxococcota bacterium]